MSFGSRRLLQIYFFCNEIIFCLGFRQARDGFFSFKINFMVSIKMIAFYKSTDCPSSQQLLAFQSKKKAADGAPIREHLIVCEFCSAEIEFYARYPQSNEPIPQKEIPLPLYELAEALLSNKHKDFKLLNKLLTDSDSFNLVKV